MFCDYKMLCYGSKTLSVCVRTKVAIKAVVHVDIAMATAGLVLKPMQDLFR